MLLYKTHLSFASPSLLERHIFKVQKYHLCHLCQVSFLLSISKYAPDKKKGYQNCVYLRPTKQ
jgi:hypothetical protein